ncbi:outer membrane protein assembly factor BamA [Thermodesulfovibrio sp. 3462-1]|uniref:Outer membrane protein assembly factor BamA n=1 Tax=Thermodesulfovibrio obliviosus TaxID=3118332 RepID=A0AAU8H1F1_9BACT
MRSSFVLSFVSIFILLFNFAYAAEYIKKIEIEGLKSFSKEEFLYLMGVKENQSFTPEEITTGIKRLFLKDVFDDIIVEYDQGIMKISVQEKPLIKKIEIKGNEHFSESFFKKLLSFKKGDRLKEIECKKTQHNIENELNKRGFINCQVNIEKKVFENFADITIYIKEGEPLKIKSIKWKGTFDEYIKNFLSLSVGEPFDKVILEEFINKVEKYFIKQGLIGSEISYSFTNGELTLTIKEGKKLQLEFKGVNSLSERDLKSIAMAHFQDQVNENIIKDSINSLITFYRAKGFIEVRVYSLLEQAKNEWKITYFINEGNRKFVKKVEIQTKLPREEIEKLLANKEGSFFNPEELENDKQRIEEYFKIKGYFNCKVFPPQLQEEENSVSILFKVQEGEQVKIKHIEIKVKDNLLKTEAEEIAKTYINSPFNETTFLEMKRKIREIYLKSGYSEARIEGNYEIKNSDAYVSLKIEPGSKKYFGKSIVLGNKKTKTKFIYQRLLPKESQPYNPYTLEEERQILYKTGLFSRIDIKPQPQDDSLDLIYNFEEAPAGAFEFGFGFGEYEKAKAFAELSYINLFGMNKQIFSRVELNNLEKRSYITYVDPWIWKDLTFKSSLLFEKINFKNIDTKSIIYKVKRYSASAGFEKKFSEFFKAELLYEATYSKTWDVMPEVIISDQDIGKLFISGIKASLIYDSRDNPFDPTKGWLAGVTSKLSNEFLGSELNFMKSSFYINKYTELIKGLVLATSLRGGWAWLYGKTENLPISERYFLGGRDTVRGYAQNTLGPKQNNQPTGGNAFLMGNVEFRTYLGKNFFIVNFLDFGNVWKRVGDVDVSNLKYTTGVGLRYKTLIGPLRIDYGYKLNRQPGESHGEIHFSIGHAF